MDIFQGYALLEASQLGKVKSIAFFVLKKTPGRPAISLLARRQQCKTSVNLANRFIFQNATLHGEIFLKTLCNYKIIINKKSFEHHLTVLMWTGKNKSFVNAEVFVQCRINLIRTTHIHKTPERNLRTNV